jgi:Ca2+-binding EF-hand superfamily protein
VVARGARVGQATRAHFFFGSASTKQLKTIFSLYDTNNDGLLSWNEAKRYLSDLLELSGTQANVIREARETGQTNIAQWYEQYLREMFNHLDTNQDGFIDINELVKPGRNEVANLLAAVSSKIEAPAAPGKSLVLSSKMREENISTVLNSPTSAPCINGCGFYGSAEHYGYCPSCAKLIGDAINVAVLPEDPYPNAYGQAEAPHSNNEPAAPPPAPTEEPSKTPAAVTAEAPADPPVAPPKKVTKKKRVAKKGGKKGAAPKPEEVAKPDAEPEADAEGSGSDRELSSGEEELLDSAEGGGFLEESNHDRHMKFTVLDGDQVEKLMARKIRDAAELLGSTEDEAALVLMFFDWNSTRLQEQYFLNVDKYRVLAGIDLGGGKQPLKVQAGDCTICFETVKLSETASLNCGHGPFCKGCYGDYLGEKVRERKRGRCVF